MSTTFSTVTRTPSFAAKAEATLSAWGGASSTLPAGSAAQACRMVRSGRRARTIPTGLPSGSSLAQKSPAFSPAMLLPRMEWVAIHSTPVAPASRRWGRVSTDQFSISTRPSRQASW